MTRSRTRQSGVVSLRSSRKSLAEPKARTLKPADSNRRRRALRTASSSSTRAIMGQPVVMAAIVHHNAPFCLLDLGPILRFFVDDARISERSTSCPFLLFGVSFSQDRGLNKARLK